MKPYNILPQVGRTIGDFKAGIREPDPRNFSSYPHYQGKSIKKGLETLAEVPGWLGENAKYAPGWAKKKGSDLVQGSYALLEDMSRLRGSYKGGPITNRLSTANHKDVETLKFIPGPKVSTTVAVLNGIAHLVPGFRFTQEMVEHVKNGESVHDAAALTLNGAPTLAALDTFILGSIAKFGLGKAVADVARVTQKSVTQPALLRIMELDPPHTGINIKRPTTALPGPVAGQKALTGKSLGPDPPPYTDAEIAAGGRAAQGRQVDNLADLRFPTAEEIDRMYVWAKDKAYKTLDSQYKPRQQTQSQMEADTVNIYGGLTSGQRVPELISPEINAVRQPIDFSYQLERNLPPTGKVHPKQIPKKGMGQQEQQIFEEVVAETYPHKGAVDSQVMLSKFKSYVNDKYPLDYFQTDALDMSDTFSYGVKRILQDPRNTKQVRGSQMMIADKHNMPKGHSPDVYKEMDFRKLNMSEDLDVVGELNGLAQNTLTEVAVVNPRTATARTSMVSFEFQSDVMDEVYETLFNSEGSWTTWGATPVKAANNILRQTIVKAAERKAWLSTRYGAKRIISDAVELSKHQTGNKFQKLWKGLVDAKKVALQNYQRATINLRTYLRDSKDPKGRVFVGAPGPNSTTPGYRSRDGVAARRGPAWHEGGFGSALQKGYDPKADAVLQDLIKDARQTAKELEWSKWFLSTGRGKTSITELAKMEKDYLANTGKRIMRGLHDSPWYKSTRNTLATGFAKDLKELGGDVAKSQLINAETKQRMMMEAPSIRTKQFLHTLDQTKKLGHDELFIPLAGGQAKMQGSDPSGMLYASIDEIGPGRANVNTFAEYWEAADKNPFRASKLYNKPGMGSHLMSEEEVIKELSIPRNTAQSRKLPHFIEINPGTPRGLGSKGKGADVAAIAGYNPKTRMVKLSPRREWSDKAMDFIQHNVPPEIPLGAFMEKLKQAQPKVGAAWSDFNKALDGKIPSETVYLNGFEEPMMRIDLGQVTKIDIPRFRANTYRHQIDPSKPLTPFKVNEARLQEEVRRRQGRRPWRDDDLPEDAQGIDEPGWDGENILDYNNADEVPF